MIKGEPTTNPEPCLSLQCSLLGHNSAFPGTFLVVGKACVSIQNPIVIDKPYIGVQSTKNHVQLVKKIIKKKEERGKQISKMKFSKRMLKFNIEITVAAQV